MVSIQPGPTVTSQRPAPPSRGTFSRAFLAFAIFALLVSAPAVAGENLLANPNFPDTVLTPWTVDTNGEIYWSAADVENAPGSGSLLIVDTTAFNAPYAKSECIPVTGNAEVSAGGYFRKGAASPASARVELRVIFYSSSTCKGPSPSDPPPFIGEIKTGLLVPSSSWDPIVLGGVAPAGVAGMEMWIKASAGTADATLFEFYCDALLLSHTGQLIPGLFVDGFESANTSAWSLTSNGD